MKDENQRPEITCSVEDVVSAWFVGIAVIFSLLGISLVQEMSQPIEQVDRLSGDRSVRMNDVMTVEPDHGDLELGRIMPQDAGGSKNHPYETATIWPAETDPTSVLIVKFK